MLSGVYLPRMKTKTTTIDPVGTEDVPVRVPGATGGMMVRPPHPRMEETK